MNAGDLLNANLRIAGMFLLPCPQVSSDMREAFYDNLPDQIEAFAKECGWHEEELDSLRDEDAGAWDALNEEFMARGKTMLLLKVEKPVMTPYGDGKSMSYSWGHYHMAYVASDGSFEELLTAALKWADECEATDRAQRAA